MLPPLRDHESIEVMALEEEAPPAAEASPVVEAPPAVPLTPAEVQAADEQIFADTRIEDCEVDPALYAANRLTDAERKQFDEQGYVSSAWQVVVDSAPCCCNPVPG